MTTQTKVINFATVGYGGMGSYHADHLVSDAGFKHIGVYDISEERQKVAEEKGHIVYATYEDLLADESIEAIIVATPNDSHKDISIRALQAGKHVVCEKPIHVVSCIIFIRDHSYFFWIPFGCSLSCKFNILI